MVTTTLTPNTPPHAAQDLTPDQAAAIKDKIVSLRSFNTDYERAQVMRRMEYSWPHVRPNSVYVVAMGNHYEPGSWARIIDMVLYTNSQGPYTAFQEMQDRCFEPYDALGTMRNEAAMEALYQGFEWLCYLDCDVWPEKDALLKLMAWDMPVISPYIVEPGSGRKLFGPGYEPNTGLKPARWCVLSMLMFKTTVFNSVGPRFWGDAIGADEGYHFKTLWFYGHRPWIDTNQQVIVSKPPIYPLSINREVTTQQKRTEAQNRLMELLKPTMGPEGAAEALQLVRDAVGIDGRWERLRNSRERLNWSPDRRPFRAGDPHVYGAEYLPFMGTAAQQTAPIQDGHHSFSGGNL